MASVPHAVDVMLSLSHAAALRAKIDLTRTFPPHYYSDLVNVTDPQPEHGTTHLSVMDAAGTAVAMTTTVNLFFGSRIQSASTGLLWNDEMDDFSQPLRANAFGFPPAVANYVAPGKRPLSTMCPTLVEADGGVLALGASGGSRIVTAVLQVMLRVLDGTSLDVAVAGPRLHDQLLPMECNLEQPYDTQVAAHLRSVGHHVMVRAPPWFDAVCQAVKRHPNGTLSAACDWRKQGDPSVACTASGWSD